MIGWLDLSSGASGDMLLGALVGAGVPLERLQAEIDRFGLPITLRQEPVQRAALTATQVHVDADESDPPRRTLRDIRPLLHRLSPPVEALALRTFERLAAAEAKVHGSGLNVDEVHFHEVGALDALADIAGVCAGFVTLGLTSLTAGRLALGGGTDATAHGELPIPGPAVVEVLAGTGAEVWGGGDTELCTPTGAALVATLASQFGPLPPMRIGVAGLGAGSRDTPGRSNVVRLLVGEPADTGDARSVSVVLEANVDDLDPRAWPVVLELLLAAGADDAWLTPILMKKGRPAHTVSALAAPEKLAAVTDALFRETTTLGLRQSTVTKTALAREFRVVHVDGQEIAVKVGRDAGGAIVNAMPEWDDVVRAAGALGQPAKRVLAAAQAAFEQTRC